MSLGVFVSDSRRAARGVARRGALSGAKYDAYHPFRAPLCSIEMVKQTSTDSTGAAIEHGRLDDPGSRRTHGSGALADFYFMRSRAKWLRFQARCQRRRLALPGLCGACCGISQPERRYDTS